MLLHVVWHCFLIPILNLCDLAFKDISAVLQALSVVLRLVSLYWFYLIKQKKKLSTADCYGDSLEIADSISTQGNGRQPNNTALLDFLITLQ